MPSAVAPAQPKTIPLTRYLFTRLSQLGCTSLHGVPGDYNLTALDHVAQPASTPPAPDFASRTPANTTSTPTRNSTSTDTTVPLTWIGNCNELNAGYAADGYSRIKGLGALITAFGVGELSAINAIGGAYAERARVVHIVGTPPRAAQEQGICLHHSFGDGDFRVFARMARSVTVAQANLVDEGIACAEIDRVLAECVRQSRPVYIELPTDMVNVPVDCGRIDVPIDLSLAGDAAEAAEAAEDEVLKRLLTRISAAKQPFLIIDGFCARYDIFTEIEELVKLLGWPTTSTPFGKSCINETLPNFHGIYAGLAGRDPAVYKPWVESCDLVLRFGGLDSDVNTYGFSTLPPPKATVNFHRDHVIFGDDNKTIQGTQIKSVLTKLLQTLHGHGHVQQLQQHQTKPTIKIPQLNPYPTHLGNPREELVALGPTPTNPTSAPIEQAEFWRRISHFFRPGDIILTETGTPSVGSREFVLPRNTRLINSSIWLSIGYMLPAAQGAALAVREIIQQEQEQEFEPKHHHQHPAPTTSSPSGRTILFQGDGSFQMSAQELSTLIRHKLPLTFFLLNNSGYTIERFIHGMRAHYNDVAEWRYLDAPGFFGGAVNAFGNEMNGEREGEGHQAYKILTRRAETWAELLAVLDEPVVRSGRQGLVLIEVVMRKDDAPDSLKKLVRNVKRRNSGDSAVDEDEDYADSDSGMAKGTIGSGSGAESDRAVEGKIVKAAG
jgi:pyruvate decarboxylase